MIAACLTRLYSISRLFSISLAFLVAASIAIILTLGNAAQSSFRPAEAVENDYNYENYKDSYDDPEMAYDQISDALQMVSQSLSEASKQDSLLREQVGNQPKGQ